MLAGGFVVRNSFPRQTKVVELKLVGILYGKKSLSQAFGAFSAEEWLYMELNYGRLLSCSRTLGRSKRPK